MKLFFLQALNFHITKQTLKMIYQYGQYAFIGDQIRTRDFLHTGGWHVNGVVNESGETAVCVMGVSLCQAGVLRHHFEKRWLRPLPCKLSIPQITNQEAHPLFCSHLCSRTHVISISYKLTQSKKLPGYVSRCSLWFELIIKGRHTTSMQQLQDQCLLLRDTKLVKYNSLMQNLLFCLWSDTQRFQRDFAQPQSTRFSKDI